MCVQSTHEWAYKVPASRQRGGELKIPDAKEKEEEDLADYGSNSHEQLAIDHKRLADIEQAATEQGCDMKAMGLM